MKTRSHGIFHRHFEYFFKVAETGNLTMAAKLLGVTQSALSHAITALELEWKIKLFDRLPRGVKLTPDGRNFLNLCQNQMRQFTGSMEEMKLSPAAQSEIRIASVEHFAKKFLFPVMAEFQKMKTIQLYMVRSYAAFSAVEGQHVDFAFISWTRKPHGLNHQLLRKEPLAIAGLKGKYDHIAKAKKLEELNHETWVHTPKPQYEWWESLSPHLRGYVAGGFYSQKEAILAGLGIGEAQLDAFTDAEKKKLVFATVETLHPNTEQYLIYRPDLEKSKREFMQIFVKKLFDKKP